MTVGEWDGGQLGGGPALPLALLASSLIPAAIIFLLPERCEGFRRTVNMLGATVKVALVAVLVVGVFAGREYRWSATFLPGIDLVLRIDAIPLLFVSLSAVLWLTTTIYAIGYLDGDRHRARFFGFFSLCVAATVGIALAGNPVTFLVFYELLTISTYPLIVHQGTGRALSGGRTYLLYTVSGGAVLLVGTAWLHAIAGPVEFGSGPESPLDPLVAQHRPALIAVFALMVAGLGVKAALVPLHGWLPRAMVAPAPVSALLHAVAVVKAGVYGIVLVIYDLYGIRLAAELGVLYPLAAVATVTIVYGSLRALVQDDLKRRLAYSTVSQLSYIVLGISILGVTSTIGGLVHLVHQGIMKVTLFYCAGNLGKALGVTRVSEMDGVGRRLPVTMTAFTLAAAGMIGLPPTAGFVSKWYLGLGGVQAGHSWVLVVLLISSGLNAAYFLPPVIRAWFPTRPDQQSTHSSSPSPIPTPPRRGYRFETSPWLLLPAVATGAGVVVVGLFAAAFWSPLSWAAFIAEGIFDGIVGDIERS